MFIFSNWKINRKEENTQRKPFKQNEDQKGSIFKSTKGLNFPKENEIFSKLYETENYIEKSGENENIRKEIIVNIFIHKQKISKRN